jgi:hypothetical protein
MERIGGDPCTTTGAPPDPRLRGAHAEAKMPSRFPEDDQQLDPANACPARAATAAPPAQSWSRSPACRCRTAEKDGLLGLFSGRTWTRRQITWWWEHHTGPSEGLNMQDMPGTDEIIQQMLDSLPVEQRLAGLPPEQRLAGLAPEQQLLALSGGVVRGLRPDYLGSLAPAVQEAIRRSLGTQAPQK